MGRPKLVVQPDDPLTLKAAELYRNGASLKVAAKAVYMSTSALIRRFDILGFPVRAAKRTPPEIVEAIQREYVPYKNGLLKLAKKYGVSTTTVQNYARKR